jgi:DNA-binding PadR family transcriptional regulator
MNVRTLCLAILHHQDATGYEIRKLSTEGQYAYFVDASFGSIYPALAKLEDEGLVSCRQEQQDGKPPRKIYTINDKGRAALRSNLQEAPSADVFRSEFLLIGMCADLLESGDLKRALDVHVAQVEDELTTIEEISAEMEGSGCGWLPDFGRACMKAQLDWLAANRERIIAEGEHVAINGPNAGVAANRHDQDDRSHPPPPALAELAELAK